MKFFTNIRAQFYLYCMAVCLVFLLIGWFQVSQWSHAAKSEIIFDSILLGISLGLSVLFTGSLFLSRVLIKPLNILNNEIRKFADGDFNVHVPVTSADEIGRLSHNFNQMAISLKQSRAEIQAALAVKDEFTSMVSHELRTPLAITKEALSLILREKVGKISSDQKEILGLAASNIDRLSLLINDLLDISRYEAGKMHLNKEEVDVVALIKESCRGWQLSAEARKIHFHLVAPHRPIVLKIDQLRFNQALSNLISNAVKFTPEGGEVKVLIDEKPSEVVFSVRDTGPGIAAEDFSKLFKKFQQLGRTQGSGLHGTGLGLNIVKLLVELHGGKVGVNSEVEKGSCFFFNIPK